MSRAEVTDLIDRFYPPTILLVPGRPGDHETLSPGMEGAEFKDTPSPDRETPTYTDTIGRLSFDPKYPDIAIVQAILNAATGAGMRKVGGIHIEANPDGTPFICPLLRDPTRLIMLEGVVHVVSRKGWHPDKRTTQPNGHGNTLHEPVRWYHDKPQQVTILGSVSCKLADAQIPIADVQNAQTREIFYWAK